MARSVYGFMFLPNWASENARECVYGILEGWDAVMAKSGQEEIDKI